VLASLWKAEDASTNLLTEVFLEQLAAGQDKAQALQTARQRLREAGYLHPFYWAGFVLIGEQGSGEARN
jgi:CHAT domain-containing protein